MDSFSSVAKWKEKIFGFSAKTALTWPGISERRNFQKHPNKTISKCPYSEKFQKASAKRPPRDQVLVEEKIFQRFFRNFFPNGILMSIGKCKEQNRKEQ